MSGALLPLRARHCLVTGAYGGIGAAIASRFAAEGALVTLLGRKEDKLRDLCAQLPPFRDHRLAPLTSSAAASASSSPSEAKPVHSYAVMDVSGDARDEAVLDDIWVCLSPTILHINLPSTTHRNTTFMEMRLPSYRTMNK